MCGSVCELQQQNVYMDMHLYGGQEMIILNWCFVALQVRKTIQQKVTYMALADCKTAKGLQLRSGHTSIYSAVKTLM